MFFFMRMKHEKVGIHIVGSFALISCYIETTKATLSAKF